jgi:lysophospholipase
MIGKLIHQICGLYSRLTTAPNIPSLHALDPRFQSPDDLTIDYIDGPHGHRLRYAIHDPDGPVTHQVIFTPGHTEFIEKYHEVMRDLADRHIRFVIIEPVGYGGSDRLVDNSEKAVIPGYDQDVENLAHFIGSILEKSDLPTTLAGHSRGGFILAKYLTDTDPLPDPVTKAVLFSPMFSIDHHLPGPDWMKSWLRAHIKKRATDPDTCFDYLPGQGDYHPSPMPVLKKLSSDPTRRLIQPAYEIARPNLRIGGVTYQWMEESLSATDAFNPAKLMDLNLPIDLAWGDKDQVVDINPFKYLEKITDPGPLAFHRFSGARHELLMERNSIRKQTIKLLARHG